LTYPQVPYSNEYVNEFKDRYMKELQWKKDEIETLNKQYWDVQEELECHCRAYNRLKHVAECEALEHKITYEKMMEAELQIKKVIKQ